MGPLSPSGGLVLTYVGQELPIKAQMKRKGAMMDQKASNSTQIGANHSRRRLPRRLWCVLEPQCGPQEAGR